MITPLSIAFEDFLGSSIAPQVMPPWCSDLILKEIEYRRHILSILTSFSSFRAHHIESETLFQTTQDQERGMNGPAGLLHS